MEKYMKVLLIRACWAPVHPDPITNIQHKKGDIITVTEGHGRELIAFKKAVEYTEKAEKEFKAEEKAAEAMKPPSLYGKKSAELKK